MKKAIITGSSSGLGHALAEKFSQNFKISGWDKLISKKYDLRKEENVQKLIDDCLDADVFINNAMVQQSRLLELTHKLWKLDRHKVIINIGSACTYYWSKEQWIKLCVNKELAEHYYQQKLELENTHKKLVQNDGENEGPLLILVRVGLMRSKPSMNMKNFLFIPKLEPEYVAGLIYDNYLNNNLMQDIVLSKLR